MTTTEIILSSNDGVLRKTTNVQKVVEWKIKNFFDPPVQRFTISSPSFEFLNVKWNMIILLWGNSNDWIDLYLQRRFFPTEVFFSFTLGIKRADGSVFKSVDVQGDFHRDVTTLGFTRFLPRSALLNAKDALTLGNTLTVFCAFHMGDADTAVMDRGTQTSNLCVDADLSGDLKALLQSQYKADITVRVEGKELLVHKVILAARSDVFRTMFEADMVEKKDSIINIEDCELGPFEDFLQFMYSGKFDIVKPSNVLKLCLIADKYNVTQLKGACLEMVDNELSAELVCDAVYLATLFNRKESLDTATDFFTKNMQEVICFPKWLQFLSEHTTLANSLLMKVAEKLKNID